MNVKMISIAVFALMLGGCAAQTFTINGDTKATPTLQESQHFFVNGLAQGKTADVAGICGGVDKIIKVEAQQTFVNGIWSVLSFGIYTPRDVKVYCKIN